MNAKPMINDEAPAHVNLDFSSARRVLAFGDVHGRVDVLRNALEAEGFDPAQDRLVGLGDWLDRGPDTTEIADFIEEMGDALVFVIGNHEQMLADAVRRRNGRISPLDFIRNGGAWIFDYADETDETDEDLIHLNEAGQRIVRSVCNAPIAITITTPEGYKAGFVHADTPRDPITGLLNWRYFTERLEDLGRNSDLASHAMWNRREVEAVEKRIFYNAEYDPNDDVHGIDHVFYGHTIMEEPMTWGNRSWIDIGAYRREQIALIDVGQWIDARIEE